MYDFEQLNVQQLIEKQIEIRKKISQASKAGMSAQIINQMQMMLDELAIEVKTKSALEREQKDRDTKIENGEDPDEDDSLIIGE